MSDKTKYESPLQALSDAYHELAFQLGTAAAVVYIAGATAVGTLTMVRWLQSSSPWAVAGRTVQLLSVESVVIGAGLIAFVTIQLILAFIAAATALDYANYLLQFTGETDD